MSGVWEAFRNPKIGRLLILIATTFNRCTPTWILTNIFAAIVLLGPGGLLLLGFLFQARALRRWDLLGETGELPGAPGRSLTPQRPAGLRIRSNSSREATCDRSRGKHLQLEAGNRSAHI